MDHLGFARKTLALIRELQELAPKLAELSNILSDTDEKIGSFLSNVVEPYAAKMESASALEGRHINWVNDPNSMVYRSAKFLKGLHACQQVFLSKPDLHVAFGSVQTAATALLAMSNYGLINLNYSEETGYYEIEEATDLLSNCPILKMCMALNQAFSWPSPDPEDMQEAKMRFLEAIAKDVAD